MRVIDRTPLQDPDGNINPIARIQGTLKYGFNWYAELEAQKRVIAQLDRMLDKGFVLIRNFTLPEVEIVIPMILIGPGSLSVILVSPIKGEFEAKGAEWNTVTNGVAAPASRNLIELLVKLTRAFQKYLDVNKIGLPFQAEPVLIASDPGATIEAVRPLVRVVRSDALKQFASTVNQAAPALRAEQILSAADLIVEPSPRVQVPPSAEETAENRPLSRAQAIFKAGENPTAASNAAVPPPAQANKAKPAAKKSRGISGRQMILLVVLGFFECCILAAGVYFLFFFQ